MLLRIQQHSRQTAPAQNTAHSSFTAVAPHEASSDSREHSLCFQESKTAWVEGGIGLLIQDLKQFIQPQAGNVYGRGTHSEDQ